MVPAVQQQTKKCPACAELILVEAIKCKHCGERLDENREPDIAENREHRMIPVSSRRTVFGAILGSSITTILFCLYWFGALATSEGVGESQLGFFDGLGLAFGVFTAVGTGTLLGQFMRGLYPHAFTSGKSRSVLSAVAVGYTVLLFVLGEIALAAAEYIPVNAEHHTLLALICLVGGPAATLLAAKMTPMRLNTTP